MNTIATILQNQSEQIISRYLSGISANKLSIEYGTSNWSIINLLKSKNVKIRSRKDIIKKIDENFFEKIDTHTKAQILGLIYSDGCLYLNPKTNKYSLHISLARGDEYYLYQIKRIMKSEYDISRCQKFNSKKPGNLFSTFSTYNQKICQDLLKLGVHPRKSLDLNFPNEYMVPNEFLGSFILGVVEGDGSFFETTHSRIIASICCTKEFADVLKNKLKMILNINSSISLEKSIYKISILGTKQAMLFIDWIYKNCSPEFRMERKYNNYLKIKQDYQNRLKYWKTQEYRTNIKNKKIDQRKKLNGKSYYEFYVKDPNGKIYFSNRQNRFCEKFNLIYESFIKLTSKKYESYIGWTLPTDTEINNAKINNLIENIIFKNTTVSDETKNKINKAREKLNGKINREFYIKDPNGKIYFSNRVNMFASKYSLYERQLTDMLNNYSKHCYFWTKPTEQEILDSKNSNSLILEIFEPKIQEKSKIFTNFYLKSDDGIIYYSTTLYKVIEKFPNINKRHLRNTIKNKVWRRNKSGFIYPTNQEIEQAKQNNSIIVLN